MKTLRAVWLVCCGCVLAGAAGAVGPDVAPFGLGAFGRDEPIEIQADELEAQDRSGERRLAFRRNVRVRQGPLRLEAQVLEARYPEGARQPDRLWARGRVRIREGARRAHCSEARYDRPAQRIVCRGAPAELWDGEDRLTGGLVTFDLAARSVHVTEAAALEIHRDLLAEAESLDAAGRDSEELLARLRESGPLSIRAGRLDARDTEDGRRITFVGDVVVRQGELELSSSELEVAYPGDATRPDRLIARENVVIREGRREARCERAEFRPADRLVSCEGNARLRDADDLFQGDRIQFDFAARRVDAIGRARLRVDPSARGGRFTR